MRAIVFVLGMRLAWILRLFFICDIALVIGHALVWSVDCVGVLLVMRWCVVH